MRSPAACDLDEESRRALEFDALLDWVASFARTRLGAEQVRALVPLASETAVRRELEAVAEVQRYVEREGLLLAGALPDPTAALEALAVAELRLEPGKLRALGVLGSAALDLRSRLGALDPTVWPCLGGVAADLPDLGHECRAVLEGIGPEGRIEDRASPELGRIRAAITRTSERLERLLVGILRDPGSEPLVQDEFITRRNGRFVIPVRTDAPRPLAGIVHASSSSGATRFIEPLESIELNNELVRLAEEEQEEEQRILAAWSDAFRRRLPEVVAFVSSLSRLDGLQARALYAREAGAVPARVARGGPLRLHGVRHPLLDRRLREAGTSTVPLTLALDPADRVLVISGPNTGGKTVALKTLGLSVLLAQSGIPVPARDLELPLYRQIRADIGDHQSIQADLSTYSAHIRAVAGFLAAPEPPALFLFDEIGTGTEPTEGAALARAILESLERPGITAVATTHLGPLKAWAFSRERAAAAAMEFDAESLRPTFHLLLGAAGTSAGLDIAERLGLPAGIVEQARAYLDPESRRGEGYLRHLRELVAGAEQEREELARSRRALEDERIEAEARLASERARQGRTAAEALDRAVRELGELGRGELAKLTERRERARAEREWAKAEGRLQSAAAAQRAELTRDVAAAPQGAWREAEAGRLAPGMRVLVAALGQEGNILALAGQRVEVRLGGMSLVVAPSELRVPAEAGAGGPSPRPRGSRTPESAAPVAPSELMLLGKRVEEALSELDRFLDAALLAGHERVRIVHGHGTGRLKMAVRRWLASDGRVGAHRPGAPEEGGDGATVVTLR